MTDVLVKSAFQSAFSDTGDTTRYGPTAHNASRLFSAGNNGDMVVRNSTSATGASWAPAPLNVAAYGAVGNGVTDDAAAIQAAITAATSGGIIYLPTGDYLISTSLLVPANVRLVGAGESTIVRYTGTSYAVIGGGTSVTLSYGIGVESLRILLTVSGGNGITLRGTASACIRDVAIERTVASSSTGTGVFLDGSNAATIFTRLDNVRVSHLFTGFREGSTGASFCTSTTATACDALTDVIASSIGFRIDSANGDGSLYIGGNAETCAIGISAIGNGVTWLGVRFEGNTNDLTIGAACRGNSFIGCQNLSVITDSAAHLSNQFLGNVDGSNVPVANKMGSTLTISGGAVFLADAASAFFNIGTSGGWYLPSNGRFTFYNGVASSGATLKLDALPTVASGFGTSPAVTAGSTPLAGSVNVGTGGIAVSGVINFNGVAFPSAPFVVCMNTTTGAVVRAVASTTQLTITAPVAFVASDVITWICVGSI